MMKKEPKNYRENGLFVKLLESCRLLRKNQTNAERMLWSLLRNKQIGGLKFKRQHQFGPFILDFYCSERRIAIEVDGGQHYEEDGQRNDLLRDLYLKNSNIKVLCFSNNDVIKNSDAVLLTIWHTAFGETENYPHPNPLPEGEGRRG